MNNGKSPLSQTGLANPIFHLMAKQCILGKRYKKRTESGWSEIERLGSPFEEIKIMRMTSSSMGTFVFDEIGMPNGDGVLRYSRLVEGKREAPRPFGKTDQYRKNECASFYCTPMNPI